MRHAGVGNARERHSVKFYLVAMIFLLFDIEVAFLYPWAMSLRDLGWAGYFQILTFFAILTVGYVYVWRKGVLDWGPAVIKRTRTTTAAGSQRAA
jgi:NADH-quinone oxidoreductase subunit A